MLHSTQASYMAFCSVSHVLHVLVVCFKQHSYLFTISLSSSSARCTFHARPSHKLEKTSSSLISHRKHLGRPNSQASLSQVFEHSSSIFPTCKVTSIMQNIPFQSRISEFRAPDGSYRIRIVSMWRAKCVPVQGINWLNVPIFDVLGNTHIKEELPENSVCTDAWLVLQTNRSVLLALDRTHSFVFTIFYWAGQEKVIARINCHSS